MPRMITWTDRKSFSLQHDAFMSRISGFDDRNHEHWMVIEDGKGYRERREEALLAIQAAIEDGHLPGEVKP